MKRTLLVGDNKLHLAEGSHPTTKCGLDVEDLFTEKTIYNKDAYEEALAEYFSNELCEICFPEEKDSTATFETKAELLDEEEAEAFVESVKGERI